MIGIRRRSAESEVALTRSLALAGVFGPPLFVVVLITLGAIKPGFNALTQAGSEESIGDLGWVQNFNFVIDGLALMVLAIALLLGQGDRRSGRIGGALIATAGVGLVCAGIFVTDPGFRAVTVHGNLHMVASLLIFPSLMIGAVVFAKRFWRDRGFAIFSIVSGLIIPISLVTSFSLHRWPGLFQRVMIVVVWTWLTLLALRLRASVATTFPGGQTSRGHDG